MGLAWASLHLLGRRKVVKDRLVNLVLVKFRQVAVLLMGPGWPGPGWPNYSVLRQCIEQFVTLFGTDLINAFHDDLIHLFNASSTSYASNASHASHAHVCLETVSAWSYR